ncbi:hypothetical protein B0I37DRAFT_3320 [Chaetomium sp. MPI-CAGE-AT-0009]|nr:hypothetical protein B0I37DRAFT_3320 [Chaetomium sp. MPI-CAGE-AT-0009]
MCPPSNPPARTQDDAGPDEEQLIVRPAAAPAGFDEPPVQPEPVKLVYKDRGEGRQDAPPPPATRYDPNSPRRYHLLVPIRLPFALRPDAVAPPPYYSPPGSHCDGLAPHRDAHMAVLRPVLAGALRALLGPDAPVHRMVDAALLEEHHEGAVVDDRDVNFDLERGWWKDQYGREGHVIDAYWDVGDSVYVVQFFEFRLSWRVGADDVDPPIVKLVARDEPDDDGEAVFDVSEPSERLRLSYNRAIRERGDWDL